MSWEQTLSQLLSSEIRGDLLILFHRNPGLIDTIEGIARRVGRTPSSIQADIKDLTKLGVLKQTKIGASEVIALDRRRDKEILDSLANHLKIEKVEGQN